MEVDLAIEPGGLPGLHPPAQAAVAADLLVLLRLALNEGEMTVRGHAALQRVAEGAFGIEPPSLELLLLAIKGQGVEDATRAGAMIRAKPKAERLLLVRAVLRLARRDAVLKAREKRLRARLAAIADVEEGEIG